jgi:hypothetical protein
MRKPSPEVEDGCVCISIFAPAGSPVATVAAEGRLAAESKVGVTSSALWMHVGCQWRLYCMEG